MKISRSLAAAALFTLLAAAPAGAAGPDRPLTELPQTPSLDVASMDRSADPCVDLYRYSCGGWIARNPIPADKASWSQYGKLYQENQAYLWGLLEQAAEPRADRPAVEAQLGDYFAACMDVEAVDAAGAQPIADDLGRLFVERTFASETKAEVETMVHHIERAMAERIATAGEDLQPRDGLTPEQRFFVGFAQWACSDERAEAKRLRARTNPHSPAEYRINGVVANMPEFARAFACKPGQPMVREEVCRVW